ncbi:hypothetical protein OIU77_026947 [Salix suchowensis]|uniref:Uncharacterized protein n=1 Tax=Salix suchowensis TaxID=1278906 RepID=A0ABQ9BMW8_9ROSI|nr:hypothetical protein OIU77_026947 [Salix suchowensis]
MYRASVQPTATISPDHLRWVLGPKLFFSFSSSSSLSLSAARFLGIQEGHVLPNPPDELIIYEVEMRKLTEMEAMVDYQKDPKPNPKHEPPKKPGGNGP